MLLQEVQARIPSILPLDLLQFSLWSMLLRTWSCAAVPCKQFLSCSYPPYEQSNGGVAGFWSIAGQRFVTSRGAIAQVPLYDEAQILCGAYDPPYLHNLCCFGFITIIMEMKLLMHPDEYWLYVKTCLCHDCLDMLVGTISRSTGQYSIQFLRTILTTRLPLKLLIILWRPDRKDLSLTS